MCRPMCGKISMTVCAVWYRPTNSLTDWAWRCPERQVRQKLTTGSRTTALFIGYAPSDQPQYAIAVRIANGYSSGNACTTANDIMEYIFDLADKDTILTGYASTDVSNTSND